jgi:xylulokinase
MMRNDIDAVRSLGIKIDRIISMGGGASSRLWCQIKSDTCKIRLDVPENTETALLGAALIALVSLGFYDSLGSAAKNTIKMKETFLPDKKNYDAYDRGYAKYRTLYDNLKKLF